MNHQWSKGEEFERALRRARRSPRWGPASSVFSYLRPRTELWVCAAVRRASPATTGRSAAATAPSTRTRPSASTTGAAAATSAASSTSSSPRSWTASDLGAVFAGDEPLENPANEERFRALARAGRRRQAVRVRRATSTSAGPPLLLAAQREDRADTALLQPLRRRAGRRRDTAAGADAASLLAAAGPPPHPGSLCASRSPGPRSLTRPSASGGWASRAGPASAASGPWASSPVLVDDTPAAAALDGLEVLATGAGRPRRAAALRRRGQEPGHQPLPARGGAARGGRGGRVRRTGPVHGGGRPDPRRLHHRHEGQEHHDGPGRAPPHAARLPGPGRRQHRAPAVGPVRRSRQPDYWIIETSSFQVPDLLTAPRGGRRDLAVARPSRLARDGRALLRRQALAVHQARRDAGPGRRLRRRAPRAMRRCSGRTCAG